VACTSSDSNSTATRSRSEECPNTVTAATLPRAARCSTQRQRKAAAVQPSSRALAPLYGSEIVTRVPPTGSDPGDAAASSAASIPCRAISSAAFAL